MDFKTPEQAGISSRHVLAFYKKLDSYNLTTHAIILSRGNSFFSECYYAPFHKDFKHRMYSTSKSFLSIAVGENNCFARSNPRERRSSAPH